MAALATGMLTLAGIIVFGEPATANHLDCGSVVTSSVTLDRDLGPCDGDGLVVQGSNITLNLGGHTLTGNNTANFGVEEQAGIHLIGASRVTVRNGTVRNFDAGVVIDGGSGNTVTGVLAQDNANHVVHTGALNPCEFADGILILDSSNNRIQGNRAIHNGPFGGIDIVGNSDGNVVTGNISDLHNIPNFHPSLITEENEEGLGPCGPFGGGSTVGRLNQGIGIRVEGPGSDNNRVEMNTVRDNILYGIAVHGYVCHPPGPFPPQPNNGGNTIRRNNALHNGYAGPEELGDGIAVLSQGPAAIVCVAFGNSIVQNTSIDNAGHGIFLGGRGSHSNNISGNVVRDNGLDGIRVTGPGGPTSRCGVVLTMPCPGAVNNTLRGNVGSANGEHDAHDGNPNCDNNAWRNNRFGTVFRGCERNG
ncbi:MAG TPA: right-handed parallel beta-helix repeat-containing protein [Acidimicrobiales bacterium]|nr:right-handed parallel beta-helix repeat-containing protein [Acidimicrobiales bacterium]